MAWEPVSDRNFNVKFRSILKTITTEQHYAPTEICDMYELIEGDIVVMMSGPNAKVDSKTTFIVHVMGKQGLGDHSTALSVKDF